MTKINPNLREVRAYVGVETFNKIEDARGYCSRSAFVANVLETVFEDFRPGID